MGIDRHGGFHIRRHIAEHTGQQAFVHPNAAVNRIVIFIQRIRRQPGRMRQQTRPLVFGHLQRLLNRPCPFLLRVAAVARQIVRADVEQIRNPTAPWRPRKIGMPVHTLVLRSLVE